MGSLIFKGAWAHGMPWDLGPFVHGCKGSWAHWLKAARFQWEGDATKWDAIGQWDATANPPIWDHASHSLDGRQREAMGSNAATDLGYTLTGRDATEGNGRQYPGHRFWDTRSLVL